MFSSLKWLAKLEIYTRFVECNVHQKTGHETKEEVG